MERDAVGYGFRPSDEELIDHFLRNKILGKLWLVDAIREIIICQHDPESLPPLSMIKSKDPEWYFFYPMEYKTPKKTTALKKPAVKRTTPSGFWKSTGKDRVIKGERGNGVVIGFKKTLVYHLSKDVSTPWVIHEYHITCLPSHLDQGSYVICKLKYKGEDANRFLVNNTTHEVEQAVHENLHGLSLMDLPIQVPEQEELPPRDGFILNTAPEPFQGNFDGLHLDDLSNPIDPTTALEVEEAVLENSDDFSLDYWLNVMIEQEELLPGDGFDPNGLCEVEQPVHEELPPGDGSDPNTHLTEPNTHSNLNLQPQTPYDDAYYSRLLAPNREDSEDEFFDLELILQTFNNDHMPKKPLSGSINSDSDSDTEATSGLSYQGTSSPAYSVGSSNSCKDVRTCADPSTNTKKKESQLTSCTIPSTQDEVEESKPKATDASTDKELSSSMAKTEKKGWFVTEKAMKRNRMNPPCINLLDMIRGLFPRKKKERGRRLHPLTGSH